MNKLMLYLFIWVSNLILFEFAIKPLDQTSHLRSFEITNQ